MRQAGMLRRCTQALPLSQFARLRAGVLRRPGQLQTRLHTPNSACLIGILATAIRAKFHGGHDSTLSEPGRNEKSATQRRSCSARLRSALATRSDESGNARFPVNDDRHRYNRAVCDETIGEFLSIA